MKQRNLSLGVRIGLGFLSFLLCVALFATTICTCLIASGRVLTSAGNLQQIIQELLTSSKSMETAAVPQKSYTVQPLSTTVQSSEDLPADTDISDALLDFIYEAVQAEMGVELPLTRAELNDFIERSTAKDYLAEKAAGMVSDFIRGEATTAIEPEEIRQLIEENEELLCQIAGAPLAEDFKDQIVTWVEENETIERLNKDGIISLIPTPDDEPNSSQGLASSLYQLNEVMGIVRSVISISTLLCFIGVCLVLMGLIILCNWGTWGTGMRLCGYPVVVAGLPLFLCLSARFGSAPADDPIMKVIWTAAASLSGVFAIVFLLGIALIAGGFVVSHLQKKALLEKSTPIVTVPITAEPILHGTEALSTQQTPAEEDPTQEE